MKGHGDLRLVVRGSLLCAIVALLLPWPVISLVFAAPLALFAPGYAVVAAAFARHSLDRPRLAVLSLALSLAVLALGALVLNYLPGGVNGVSWAILLLAVVLGCSRSAARRRDHKPGPLRLRRPKLEKLELGFALGGLAALGAALVLASATLPAERAIGYTELWIVPQPESEGREAEVGVKSEEQETTEFDLGIRIGQSKIVRRSFTLAPGEETVVPVGPLVGPPGSTAPVVATLLLDEDPTTVYRRVEGSLTSPLVRG